LLEIGYWWLVKKNEAQISNNKEPNREDWIAIGKEK
jgi:hypothetical protein